MINQELLSYIQHQLNQGYSPTAIVQALRQSGWSDGDIVKAFSTSGRQLTAGELQQLNINPAEPRQTQQLDQLPGVQELLAETWNKFKQAWLKLLAISLIPTAIFLAIGLVVGAGAFFTVVPSALGGSLSSGAVWGIVAVGIIALIAVIVIQTWASLAGIYLANNIENTTVKQAFTAVRSKIFKAWGVMLLSTLIIWGGMLAIVIPGIILGVWLTFAVFVVVNEDIRGLKAIIKSREYVRGYWWKVLWRMMAPSLLLGLILMVLSIIFSNLDAQGIVTLIETAFNLLAAPASILYLSVLYQKMVMLKPELRDFKPKKKQKIGFIAWAVFGVAALAVIPLLMMRLIKPLTGQTDQLYQQQQLYNQQQIYDQNQEEMEQELEEFQQRYQQRLDELDQME